jgi:hypothetical protein
MVKRSTKANNNIYLNPKGVINNYLEIVTNESRQLESREINDSVSLFIDI